MSERDTQRLLASSIAEFLSISLVDGAVTADKQDKLRTAVELITNIFNNCPAIDLPPLQSIFDFYLHSQAQSKQQFRLAAAATNSYFYDKVAAEECKKDGNVHLAAKNYPSALESYTQAIKMDSTDPVYYSNRAASYTLLGNHVEARKDAENAIRIDSSFVKAYGRLGHALYSSGDLAAAAIAYQRGLLLDAHSANLQSGLERTLSRIRGSASASNLTLQEMFTNPMILAEWLTDRFRESGQKAYIDGAISAIDQWLAIVPNGNLDRPGFLMNLGVFLENRFDSFGDSADFERAISSCEAAIAAFPMWDSSRPVAFSNLSFLLFKRYNISLALTDYNRGIWALEQSINLRSDTDPDRLTCTYNLGVHLQMRYDMFGSLADHERALSILEDIFEQFPEGHPKRFDCLNALAGMLLSKFRQSGVMADLERSVSLYEMTFTLIPNGHPEQSMAHCNLGVVLLARFEVTRQIVDINRAVALLEEGVSLTPDDYPHHHQRWSKLAGSLYARFTETAQEADMDRSILFIKQAIATIPQRHPNRPTYLSLFADLLLSKSDMFNVADDLHQAFLLADEAVTDTPPGHPQRPDIVSVLGRILLKRFALHGKDADLERATALMGDGALLVPEGLPTHYTRLGAVGTLYKLKFERHKAVEDLNKAIDAFDQATRHMPSSHPDRRLGLANLVELLERRFKKTEVMADLDQAISTLDNAIASMPKGDGDRPIYLVRLGSLLQNRFQWRREAVDVDRAISIVEEALRLIPQDDIKRQLYTSNLGSLLRTRFESSSNMEDLNRSISVTQNAVDATPTGPDEAATALANLAVSFYVRFSLLGNLSDLDQAIARTSDTARCMPEGFHGSQACHAQLGSYLLQRFEWLQIQTDLKQAILSIEEAIKLSPEGHPDRPMVLAYLGNALSMSSIESGAFGNLEHATLVSREAVRLTSDENPDKPIWVFNLAGVLLTRFLFLRSKTDIDDAISFSERGLSLLPDAHPSRVMYLFKHGAMLMHRAVIKHFEAQSFMEDHMEWLILDAGMLDDWSSAQSVQSMTDLDRAIAVIKQALSCAPEGHPYRSRCLLLLGRSFHYRFKTYHLDDDLDQAIESYQQILDISVGLIMHKIFATQGLVALGRDQKRLDIALNGYKAAIGLLPLLAWRGLDSESRFMKLKSWSPGLACDAAACAIEAGELEMAVELLEQGRSIFWSQASELRTDIKELRLMAPELANQLSEVGRALESGSFQSSSQLTASGLNVKGGGNDPEKVAQHYHRLAERWDYLIDKVRQMDEFKNFLLPTPFQQLRKAASHGPVVIINASKYRCDGIILTTKLVEGVGLVPLNFSKDDAAALATRLQDSLHSFSSGKLHAAELDAYTLHPILGVLWTSVASPVLRRVQDLHPSTDCRLRLWWCPTGPFTFLPIHAAGLFNGKERGVSDLVTSSYTMTLMALLRARTRSARKSFLMHVVGTASGVQGQRPLPHVSDEMSRIQDLKLTVPFEQPPLLEGSNANVDQVTAALRTSDWLHISCHGHQDLEHPMNSFLLLDDGPLNISRIASHTLPDLEFVFLSACHTAAGMEGFEDEVFHISAAFQFAGCSGVVGTMWAIYDRHGSVVSERVYRHLFRQNRQRERPDVTEAAHALRNAVRHLKRKVSLHEWVPFIHIGV